MNGIDALVRRHKTDSLTTTGYRKKATRRPSVNQEESSNLKPTMLAP